jgi:sporulation protein YlmC with PRC-barrel domain
VNDMVQCCNMKFSEMKNKDVIDSTGKRIGRLIDFHFNWEDGKVQLKSIVLGGSKIEEFLESIKVKPDIDPFFSLDVVDRFENGKLYLSVEYKKLSEPVKLGEKEMRLSGLSKLKIIDADGNKVGNIIDVWFDADGHLQFIIGGGFFEETFEKLHIRPDIDLIVTQEFVKDISADKIFLKLTKYQMESTCEAEWEKLKSEMIAAPPPTPPRHAAIWLSRSPKA